MTCWPYLLAGHTLAKASCTHSALAPECDREAEIQAVTKFIAQKWTPIENLEGLVREVQQTAYRIGSTWIEQYDTGSLAYDLSHARAEKLGLTLPPVEAGLVGLYDAQCAFMNAVFMSMSKLREAGLSYHKQWDYSRQASAVYSSVSSRFSGLPGARPHGWDALAENYSDFDGQEEYNPREDRALFEGVRNAEWQSMGFTSAVALPYVMYSEKCQSSKASRELVAAIFSHFLGIREYLNTQAFMEALKALDVESQPGPVFTLDGLAIENPFLQVVLQTMRDVPTEEEYRNAVQGRLNFELLSDEEKAALKAANSERICQRMAQLRTRATDDIAAQEEQARFNEVFYRQFAVLTA